MKTAWRSKFGILNMCNVPPQGDLIAYQNAAAMFAEHPDLIAFSEAWHASTRRGIRAAADGDYRFLGEADDSSLLAFDQSKWKLIDSGWIVLHGVVAGRFGVVSDVRRLQWAILRDRASGRMVVVGVLHVAPTATKRSRAAQAAARVARRHAFRRLQRFARRRNLPVILAGDWNATGPVLGRLLRGKVVRCSNPARIDRLETVDGQGVTLAPSIGRLVEIPFIDHSGGVISTVVATVKAA